ncbi:hypothetical protein GE21DRAFT_1313753 [Neurospora crassa]|nr:hypothetical protein GE21DRAFT_1313753 [Neurospora crassa]
MPLSVLRPPSFKRTDTHLFHAAKLAGSASKQVLLGEELPFSSVRGKLSTQGMNGGRTPGIHQALTQTATSKGAIETAIPENREGSKTPERAPIAVAVMALSLRQVRSSFFPTAGQPGKEVTNGHDDWFWEVAMLQVLRAHKDWIRPVCRRGGPGALGHLGVCTPVPLASTASRPANRIIGLTRTVRPATLRRQEGVAMMDPLTTTPASPRGKYHRSMLTHTRSLRKEAKQQNGPRIIWAVVGKTKAT